MPPSPPFPHHGTTIRVVWALFPCIEPPPDKVAAAVEASSRSSRLRIRDVRIADGHVTVTVAVPTREATVARARQLKLATELHLRREGAWPPGGWWGDGLYVVPLEP